MTMKDAVTAIVFHYFIYELLLTVFHPSTEEISNPAFKKKEGRKEGQKEGRKEKKEKSYTSLSKSLLRKIN